MLIVELVKLFYSLTAHASRYKLDIETKLSSLNINPDLLKILPEVHYPDNSKKLTFLFILGLFIGDGELYL